ncbi:hypothetical protein MMYC01_207109 [Madurella mycetomatis]|uniref:Uncharacterized protein n=1 Tax=Madurella mycetomatis TaxID=100816 RepID=A0A175VYB0_9PEZI|nr:hypothetical protein MMYC01_208554 [Madurella mycetomatis]KXX75734.1 hypothetical protein MMYC01_207109 [Madurella mycetomatis]
MANLELLHAYRKLLRAGLRAVQFSQPSRTTFVQQLRKGFRDPNGTLELERVRRTVWFLNAAAQERGLEHRILKNLCRTRFEQQREVSKVPWKVRIKHQEDQARVAKKSKKTPFDPIKGTEYEHYDRTIAMFNDTMGLCLR